MKVAIIGAGAAGLSAAHELIYRGAEVHIFEAHSLPGGCASWFRRSSSIGALQFDVGATVLDGLQPQAWLGRRFASWGVDLADFEPMPSIFYRLSRNESSIELSTNSAQGWLASLIQHFPQDTEFLRDDFSRLIALAPKLKALVEARPQFPVQTLGDLWSDVRLLPKLPTVLWKLFRSGNLDFGAWLDEHQISPELRAWIEMSLLITVQCAPREIYTPWAALALSFYPLGAGTLPQGMRGLMEPALRALVAKPQAQVSMRKAVVQILPEKNKFWIFARRADGEVEKLGPFDRVISTVPRFNTARLISEQAFREADAGFAKHRDQLWSASTAYVAIKDQSSWPTHAFNVHSKLDSGAGHDGNDAYLSFSKRGDLSRAPESYRVATLSTHTRLENWKGLSAHEYQSRKQVSGTKLLEHLAAWMGQESASLELAHVEFGTPKTFERYTSRLEGHVGGLAMTRENTLLRPLAQRSSIKGLYQIGDTSFPGQSIYACALGAISAVEKMIRDG